VIQAKAMEKAIRRQDARREGKEVGDDGDDEDDDDDVDDDDDDDSEAEEDDDDDDDDEEEDEEEGGEDGDGKRPAKRVKRTKRIKRLKKKSGFRVFDLHVNCWDLPLLDMYSRMDYMLREGATAYPPAIGDLQLQRVVSNRKLILRAQSIIQRASKVISWAFSAKTAKVAVGRSKAPVQSVADVMAALASLPNGAGRSVGVLMQDTFRPPQFYALMGVVDPRLVKMWSAERCVEVYLHLTGGDLDRLVFSHSQPQVPLDFEVLVRRREFAAAQFVMDRIDIDEFAAVVLKPTEPHDEETIKAPMRGAAFVAACTVWHHMRTACRGTGCMADMNEVPQPMERNAWMAGIGYLVTHSIAALINGYVISLKMLACISLMKPVLSVSPRLRFYAFVGDIAHLPIHVPSVIGDRPARDTVGRAVVLAPTMQAAKRAFQATGWDYQHLDADAKSLEAALATAALVIFTETHLWSVHNVGIVTRILLSRQGKPEDIHVVMCGYTLVSRFPDKHGMPFPFAHVAAAIPTAFNLTKSVSIEWLKSSSSSSSAGADADVTSTASEGKFEHQPRVIELPYGGGMATAESVADVVGAIVSVCTSERSRAPFLLFESRHMMDAVRVVPEVASMFPRDRLVVGGLAEEVDGGLRRISALWLSVPGTAERTEVQSIDTTVTPPETIHYRMLGDNVRTVRNYAQNNIVMRFCAAIGETRMSTISDSHVVAVFSGRNSQMSGDDIGWVLHVSRGAVTFVVQGNVGTMRITPAARYQPNIYTTTIDLYKANYEQSKRTAPAKE
jgi:hypothetical protein